MKDIIVIGQNIFETKVAITEEEKAKGLMFEEWPPPVMVFPYKYASYNKFWMKNTCSPLDILFCVNGEVVDIKKGEPFSLDTIGPDCPTDLVVELPAGHVKSFGIQIGDKIKLNYSPNTLVKALDVNARNH
jgi:hypothetical protein